ncbi:MAG: branched-chain amino acid transport system II carrier protein [Neisseria sp.]|nr:branched-chain amino acid transport system II carrier protein [Neisseria sp.]
MNKNTFVIGFMLFAIFFGAGNLIFPPKLGLDSGAEFWPAITGFVLTGVGLPLLGIIVSAYYEGGYQAALNRIHPWFSVLFLTAVYLAIGPFFAGPRTGATAYEMAVVPFLGEAGAMSLLAFTAVYFGIALWLSLNPSKMVDRIGSVLTPVLLLAIAALVASAWFALSGSPPALNAEAGKNFLADGILSGYFTMDALASLAFSVIVLSAVKAKLGSGASLVKETAGAGIVAAVALALIYVSLGWIGNKMPVSPETLTDLNEKGLNIGTYLLNTATTQFLGDSGRIVLGIIVSLACLTTTVGLAVAVSEYFHGLFPKIAYKAYVVLFILISFALANQGLSAVIGKSVPVLLVLYPISMTVIFLLLANIFVRIPLTAQRLSVGLVTLISILSVAEAPFVQTLPLKTYSMEWLPFALGGVLIGWLLAKVFKTA